MLNVLVNKVSSCAQVVHNSLSLTENLLFLFTIIANEINSIRRSHRKIS